MLNHIVLQGRLTRDPELRYTQSGTAVCSFTLASERDVAAEGGERKTDFIDCTAWRGSAEFVSKYFKKGNMALVSGRLELRDWTDRDGNKRRNAAVVVASVYFGESKKDGGTAQAAAPAPVDYGLQGADQFAELPDDDSDLPF